MKNCIILGSGRSGTSMLAGTLANSGYYYGDTPLPSTEGNPLGYFESREVEAINDRLINKMLTPGRWERRLSWLRPLPEQVDFSRNVYKTRWLALIPPGRKVYPKPNDIDEIRRLVSHTPYCFKDPRFSYTLPAWRPYLQDVVYVCVFREPVVTANSILKEIEREPYLDTIAMSFQQVIALWTYVYRHILENHRHSGEWVFMHYQQILQPEGLTRLEQALEACTDASFPDPQLQRTRADEVIRIPAQTERVYRQLCRLAGYEARRSSHA